MMLKETKIKENLTGNSHGFTLVELMISIGISSIIALGMVKLAATQTKTGKNVSQSMEIQDLRSLLMWRLGISTVCDSNFRPSGNAPVRVNTGNPAATNIRLQSLYYTDSNSQAIVTAGQKIPSSKYNIIVSEIKFNNVSNVSGTNEYFGRIEVDFNSNNLAFPLAPLFIPLSVLTDVTGQIQGCSTSDTDIFQGTPMQTAGFGINGYRTSTSDVSLLSLGQDYNKILINGVCACWDDGDGQWSKVTAQFLDANGSNVGLMNTLVCFENSCGNDETFGRATYDTGSILLPKPSDNVRTLRLIFDRSTTSCRSDASYSTLK